MFTDNPSSPANSRTVGNRVPAASLPRTGEVGRCVQLWQPPHGGHVGFPQGRFPGHVHALPQAVALWLAQHR